ncbi:MAG: ABC transporter permease [Actinomycetota bacterium]
MEMRLFWREPHVVVFVIGFPALTVLVLGGVFGTETDDSGFEFVNPSHFYAAAYFGVVLAAIGLIMIPNRVASYREAGVLRRFDAAGFARWVFPLVQVVSGLAFAAIGCVSLVVTVVVGGDGLPPVENLYATVLGIATGTITFVSIGVALGMLYPSGRAASGFGLALFFPMFLLSGGGPPPEAMTDGMRQIADWLPLTHVIRAGQEPWLGLGSGQDHLQLVVVMFVAATAVWARRARSVSRRA